MRSNVSIVIPVYKDFDELNINEKICLIQCFKVLSSYDICFISHRGINIQKYISNVPEHRKINYLYFEESYFKGLIEYSKLLTEYKFYACFKRYRFILIFQLDVFIFSDKLEYFLELKYDYIGAPWFENFKDATQESRIIGVGNGGFSLRKVSSHLAVLSIFNFLRSPFNLGSILNCLSYPTSLLRVIKYQIFSKNKTRKILPWRNQLYEDVFWCLTVPAFFRWYKISPVDVAIKFAFEVNPQILYALNNQKLPMATHAWEKYNIDFWLPFIEQEGYQVL